VIGANVFSFESGLRLTAQGGLVDHLPKINMNGWFIGICGIVSWANFLSRRKHARLHEENRRAARRISNMTA
jgi:hypothetical protein